MSAQPRHTSSRRVRLSPLSCGPRGYAQAIRRAGWPGYRAELDASLDRTLPVPGRQVTALLDESILLRHVGGAAAMADQIGHLIAQVEAQVTTVLIVPLNSPTLMPSDTLGHLLLPRSLTVHHRSHRPHHVQHRPDGTHQAARPARTPWAAPSTWLAGKTAIWK